MQSFVKLVIEGRPLRSCDGVRLPVKQIVIYFTERLNDDCRDDCFREMTTVNVLSAALNHTDLSHTMRDKTVDRSV